MIVEHAPGDPPRLSLLLPGDRWLGIAHAQDPVHASTDRRTGLAFSAGLPPGLTAGEIAATALFIHFRGEHLNIGRPSWERMQNDGFVRSEPVYWEHIRALPAGARVLEIGSRARSGISRRGLFPGHLGSTWALISPPGPTSISWAMRTGSRNIFPAEHFDAAFSVTVWEHLAMPWKVSLELNRVLKPGAVAMITTHQAWPSHEEPWDYFRYSEYAWPALFNAATGFEILASGMGSPAVMASALAIQHLQDQGIEWHYGYLATRCVVRKIGPTSLEWPVELKAVAPDVYSY